MSIPQQRECPVCHKKYTYPYINDSKEPKTCGDRMCKKNWEYISKRMNPLTGEYPDPDEVGKWK